MTISLYSPTPCKLSIAGLYIIGFVKQAGIDISFMSLIQYFIVGQFNSDSF